MFAAEGPVPAGVPHLDHVFVIMMENHSYSQILNNPNAPFINQYANSGNLATNYFAIAHPSLTNYLEVVGGSNFGVLTDNEPDWHNMSCITNLASGIPATDNPPSPNICPIGGTGTDAATPAIDYTNESQGPPGTINIDGIHSIPAATNTYGKTIGDQLVAAGKTWKSYQESIPLTGIDNIKYSDGFFTDLTNFANINPQQTPPLTNSEIVNLYAVKHNPFAYFRNIQENMNPLNGLGNTVDFQGANGLYANLATGNVPTFSFIAPNQCHDMHGQGNAGPFCAYDPNDDGTQAGLNPALIIYGDTTVQRLVNAIHSSPVWNNGNSAIVLLWDENDYSLAPITNQVVLVVDTNYGKHGTPSGKGYTHFSLLKSIESGLGLPCLNDACGAAVPVMTDLFAK